MKETIFIIVTFLFISALLLFIHDYLVPYIGNKWRMILVRSILKKVIRNLGEGVEKEQMKKILKQAKEVSNSIKVFYDDEKE